jgi:hypothetical protein
MSSKDRPKAAEGVTVLRIPGAGIGSPADVRTAETTTQSSGGLTGGDPQGGPQRTPERRAIDRAKGGDPEVKRGKDPDLADEPVRAPEEIDATPPHGDKLGRGERR